MIKLSFFNLMHWPDMPALVPWPVPARLFDPQRGRTVYGEYLDQYALADTLGFDWVACNEHHYSPYGLMASPTLVGAALSQRTRRARVAMLGALVPGSNPLRLAEEYAMLDNLSGGRLIAGLLRGGAHEFMGYGFNPDESRERFEEGVELILKCWTEPEPFGWEGRYYQFRTVSIWPRPVQQPHPPVYIAAGSERSARFAVKHHFGIGSGFVPTFMVRQQFDLYRRLAAEVDWTPSDDATLFDMFVFVHPNGAAAAQQTLQPAVHYFKERLMGPALATIQRLANGRDAAAVGEEIVTGAKFGEMFDPRIEAQVATGNMAVGSPDEVVQQLRRIVHESGAGVLNVRFHIGNLPHKAVLASMRLFMAEVWPHVRNLHPATEAAPPMLGGFPGMPVGAPGGPPPAFAGAGGRPPDHAGNA